VKHVAIAVVAVLAVGTASALYVAQRGSAPAASVDSIPAAPVGRGHFETAIVSIGELRAAKSAVLSSPYGGKVIKLVPEGSRVANGDPVIWFETEEYEQSLQEADAQLKLEQKDLQVAQDALELEKLKNQYTLQSEKTKVEIARQGYEDSKRKYESEQVLFEKKVTPQTNLDEARLKMLQAELELRNAQIALAKVEDNLASNLRVKEREIEKAHLRVEKSERDLAEAQEKLDKSIVYATSPGDISYLKTWKGGQVSKIVEGDTVWRTTALVEIPDPTVMLAVVPVNEIDIARVDAGQRAVVTVDALPGRSFKGVVDSKSVVPITDPAQKSWDSADGGGPREFEVRVRLEETDEVFRQGMTAAARIVISELPDTLSVPLEAVAEKDGRKGVWAKGALEARFVPVDIALTNENNAAVSGDLKAGDMVLLRDPSSSLDAPKSTVRNGGAEAAGADATPAPGGAGT